MTKYLILLATTIAVYADSFTSAEPVLPAAGDLDSSSSGISTGKPRLSRASLPLYFIENRGQLDDRVSYYVQGADKFLLFTKSGMTMDLHPPQEKSRQTRLGCKARFRGGRYGPRENWVTSLKTWKKLAYKDAWPDIDLSFSGNSEELTSTFTIRPGADPARIAMAWTGLTGSRMK